MAERISWRLKRVLNTISADFLFKPVIPDGLDGEIELNVLMLTEKGVVLLDTRDTQGLVFASEAIDEWAVMGPHGRFSIRNPLYNLDARVAAVKSLVASSVPVQGLCVFSDQASFNGSPPARVMTRSDLKTYFKSAKSDMAVTKMKAWQDDWKKLKENVINQ